MDLTNKELRDKMNLNHLSEEECEAVLKVIQRDFDLRQHEKDRLNKVEEEIHTEEDRAGILAKQKDFNENCCMRCFGRFFFLINPKVQCRSCRFNVCKSCSDYDKPTKDYICHVCKKQDELSKASGEWFYNNVKKKFKRFGSAKVVRSLYKRKTESGGEESDYAMSDSALYGRDSSTGRKNRPQLTGMFEMDLDEPSSVKPLERQKQMENGNLIAQEEDIVAEKRPEPLYNNNNKPYTCPVTNGSKTLEEVSETELKNFRIQLEAIVQDINRVLENNVLPHDGSNSSANVNAREEYEKLVDSNKLHLTKSLSNLSKSLQNAVGNDDVLVPEDNTKSSTARKQLVKQTVLKQCEDYMGGCLELSDEDITSEYGSESGTETQTSRPYEELVADAIVKKLIDENQKNAKRDKQSTRIQGEISGSDTDSSARVRDEVQMSEGSDSDSRKDHPYKVKQNYITDTELDDLVLSNLPEGRTDPSTEGDEWSMVESTRSPITTINAHPNSHSTPLKPSEEIMSPMDVENDLKILKESLPSGQTSTKIRHLPEEEILSGNAAGRQEHIIEPVSAFSDGQLQEAGDFSAFEFLQQHKIGLPSFVVEENTEAASDIDLDDISHVGSDSEEYPQDEPVVTLDGNITFGSNWSLSSSRRKDRSFISAYDNFGSKKVGKEGDAPTIMLVPRADDEVSIAKIGDTNADELSDLSENEAKSDAEIEVSSDDDDDFIPMGQGHDDDDSYFDSEGRFIVGKNQPSLKKKRGKYPRSNSGVQTEEYEQHEQDLRSVSDHDDEDMSDRESTLSGSSSQFSSGQKRRPKGRKSAGSTSVLEESEIVVEVDAKVVEQKVKEKAFDIDERPVSPDVEDVDPKFVKKPEKMVSVYEGEPIKFEVQVEGSEPLDVFWYNDMADIVDLADDERCEIVNRGGGVSTCEMFNTQKSDQGQYLCIGINELGQCSRAFKLKILDNTSSKSGPEFIKPPQDIEAVEGCTVKLRCKLKGYPQPRVQWFKDGKRIKNNERYSIEKLGNRDYVLTIDDLSLDDDAEFSVTAKNVEGEVRAIAQVIVEAKEPDDSSMSPRKLDESSSSPRSQSSSSIKTLDPDLYPDTDDLMRLAEQVQAAQKGVASSAQDMFTSADRVITRLTRMERMLDTMDNSIDNMQSDPMISSLGDHTNNNDPFTSSYRSNLWMDHTEMRDSARNVRLTTAHALDFLTSMDHDLFVKRDAPPDPEEEIDVTFTYEEYEILYKERKITTDHIRKGKVKRKDLPRLHDFLRQYREGLVGEGSRTTKRHSVEVEGIPSVIDCGLKRVDSKRYKKDYVIVRDNKSKKSDKKWEVRSPSFDGTDVVKSTPAGVREDPNKEMEDQVQVLQSSDDLCFQEEAEWAESPMHSSNTEPDQEVIDPVYTPIPLDTLEENLYLTTGQVFNIQDQVNQFEQEVSNVDDGTSQRELEQLEKQVAIATAKVTQSDKQVSEIETQLKQFKEDTPKSPTSPTESQPKQLSYYDSSQLNDSLQSGEDPEFMQVRLKKIRNALVEQEIQEAVERHTSQSDLPRQAENQSKLRIENQQPEIKTDNQDLISFESPDNNNQITKTENQNESFASKYLKPTPPKNETSHLLDGEQSSSVGWTPEENMPSVKNLLSKFNQSQTEEEDDFNLKRVYSLTGRNLPKTVVTMREKLKQRHPVVSNTNVQSNDAPQSTSKPLINTIFEDSAQQNTASERPDSGLGASMGSEGFYQYPDNPEVVSPRSVVSQSSSPVFSASSPVLVALPKSETDIDKTEYSASIHKHEVIKSEQVATNFKQPIKSTVTVMQQYQVNEPVAKNKRSVTTQQKQSIHVDQKTISSSQPIKTAVTSNQPTKTTTIARSASNPGSSSSGKSVDKSKLGPPPKRGKNSAILARAAFWDDRITHGKVQDEEINEEFPELPEDSFKR